MSHTGRIETFDPRGVETLMQYDTRGDLTRTVAGVNTATPVVTAVAFDADGRRIQSRDGSDATAGTTYDALGRATGSSDGLGLAAGQVVYDDAGRVVARADALGNVTSYAYDALGRLVATTDALGNATTTVYDAKGNVVGTVDPLGHRTTSVYDADDRLVQSVDALGNVATTAYDVLGRVLSATDADGRVTSYGYDVLGRKTTEVDAYGTALARTTTTVYDLAGRVVASVDALGRATTSVYDSLGRRVNTVDPLGHATTTVYDALNRAYVSIDALGGRTTSLFDAAGNRTTLVDPDGNRTTWAYDPLDRVTAETDPLGNAATYAYDALGRQTSTTDRLGRRIDDAFDAVGRKLTESWYATGGAFSQAMTWTYDAVGNRLTAQAPAGSYTLAYDALDRVSAVQEPFGLSLTFAYDADGNRVGVADSKGGVQTSVYDAAGRLTGRLQTGNGATLRFDESYTVRNELAAEVRYSDLAGTTQVGETDRTYDADGNAATVAQKNGTGATFDVTTYAYDLADRLTVQTDNGAARTFAYDATNQLTGDSSATYTYDANGNRTNAGYATGTGNQTTADGTWTYAYDAAGNRIKKSLGASAETWTYQYDQWNHLTRVERRATDGGTLLLRIDSAYDAFGNLLTRKQYDGSLTLVSSAEYGLDGWKTNPDGSVGQSNWDAWADLDGSNSLVNRRVYGDRTDEVAARASTTGTVAWYATDRQGSVRFLTDATGAVQTTISYDGFGTVAAETGASFADRYGYTGRELDAADGLLHLRDRDLALDLGRFLTRDPMGFGAGDADLTRYVKNDFPNAADPSGRDPVAKPAPVAVVVAKPAPVATPPVGTVRDVLDDEGIRRSNQFTAWKYAKSNYLGFNTYVTGKNPFNPDLLLYLVEADRSDFETRSKDLFDIQDELFVRDVFSKDLEWTPFDRGDAYKKYQASIDYLPGVIGTAAAQFAPASAGLISDDDAKSKADVAALYALLNKGTQEQGAVARLGGNGPVDKWTDTQKFLYTAGQGTAYLPAEVGKKIRDIVTSPTTYALVAGLFVGTKIIPSKKLTSKLVDYVVVPAIAGLAAKAGYDGGTEFQAWYEGTSKAKTAAELDEAALHFALGVISILEGATDAATARALWKKYCFAAGTPVHAERGLVPIEAVEPGDRVWSFDAATRGWRLCRVVRRIESDFDGLMVALGVGGEVVRATADHPFWVAAGAGVDGRPTPAHVAVRADMSGACGRWVDAAAVEVGDGLISRRGGSPVVTGRDSRSTSGTRVYNLEVEDLHTYAVGELGLLVHNRRSDVSEPELGSGPGTGAAPAAATRESLLGELATKGVKHTPEKVVWIGRDASGKVVFLETGSASGGLQHIVDGKAAQFAARGVAKEQIPDLISKAITEGKVVGQVGSGKNVRNVYELTYGGKPQRVVVGVSENGYIVNAHPGDW